MQNAKKFREEDLILLFLTGLNDNYAMARSHILMMEPFPQLNSVFGMIIQHEGLNKLDVVDDPTEQSSAAINFTRQAYGKGSIPPKSDKKCTYCHKNNHVVDNCFRKHGFPPGYRFRDGTVVGSKGQGQASANCVDSADSELKDQADNRMATFSTEEYQALMSLLKSSTKPAGEGPSQVHNVTRCVASSYSDKQGTNPNFLDMWILDSGATDHVCASLSLFTAYKEVSPIPVKLPNGSIKMIGSGRLINGLYYLEGTQSQSSLPTGKHCNALGIPKTALWHFRFGHTSQKRLEILHKLYPNIDINKDEFCCDICHLAKQRKLPYDLSNSRASSCLELLHMDIWGPFATPTPHGHRYFLTIVDDHTRFTWIILLKGKFETASKIQEFIQFSEEHFGHKVKYLRSDNGPEFLCLSKYYVSKVLHSVFIMNRVPSNAIQGEIPFTALHNKLPDLSQLKVFGSLCYVSNQDHHRSKLDHRARKCVYLGVKPGMKGYVALDLHNHEILVSRNVVFEETIFPYPVNPSKPSWEYLVPPTNIHSSHIAPNITTNDHETTNSPSMHQNIPHIDPIPYPVTPNSSSPVDHTSSPTSPIDNDQQNDSTSPISIPPPDFFIYGNLVPGPPSSLPRAARERMWMQFAEKIEMEQQGERN
ncbi:unnamed protein product [Trifolium pratense]|uniref:Uncharacterized protein n=1 Tax=Trifolium pratense TaxID=57577 RepID=A0ACB0JLE7_TRIPR|nr:unnamed protein product [Trifolium pratense]